MINSNTPHKIDDPLASEKVQVDRKVFFLDLKENERGRFLKITEDVSDAGTPSCFRRVDFRTSSKRSHALLTSSSVCSPSVLPPK